MHPLLAEVAPVTPSTAVALGTLISLAGLLFAYGCTQGLRWTVQKVLGALAGWLSILPGIGGVTAGVVTSVEKALSNALGQAVSGIESHIGHQWHTLARFLSMLWAEQTLVAHNLWNIAKSFYGFANTNDVRRWVNELTHRLTKAEQTLHRTVTKEIHNATKVIHTTVREVAPGIHALTHAIDVTIPREIGNLRKRARAIEDSLGRLFTRVKALENSISAGAIAAVVATVLAAIGLDWLACRDGANRAGRSGCNLWDDIGNLLGLATVVLAVEDFDTIVKEMQSAESAIASGIHDLFNL